MVALVAERLSVEQRVAVYGASEEPTVHRGVPWWPQDQLWRSAEENPRALIVPRMPLWAGQSGPMPGVRRIAWLTEPHYAALDDKVAANWDRMVVVSQWHKARLAAAHGVRPDRMTVIPNGLQPEHFSGSAPKRERHRFFWASSPDRGLLRLLRLWARIRDRLPEATLEVYNGWRAIEALARHSAVWAARHRSLRLQYEVLRCQAGVIERGMVAPVDLARAFQAASVWLYPTDVEETFCIIAIKALAAGCLPVTSALGALPETARGGILLAPPRGDENGTYDDAFVRAAVQAVEVSDAERARISQRAIAEYDIRGVGRLWQELIDG